MAKEAWNKGLKKEENLLEIRKCKKCEKEKIITDFRKSKHLYRYICKECYAEQYRTGKENTGWFKKGEKRPDVSKRLKQLHSLGKLWLKPLQKGNIPWNKGINKSEKRRCNKALIWSKEVRERDKYICQICGTINGKIIAHHIVPWLEDESRRFDIENGQTLCQSCHAKLEGFKKGYDSRRNHK